MRNLEDIEKDLAAAREALSSVKGTPAEVYSRIVGYYRSVRNWNKGKREEYGERRLYRIDDRLSAAAQFPSYSSGNPVSKEKGAEQARPPRGGIGSGTIQAGEERLLLFIRSSCPGCAPAKAAAMRLGIPVCLVNTDTAEGMTEAIRRDVLSTPTAILLSPAGKELGRAGDAETIGKLAAIGSKVHAELIAV